MCLNFIGHISSYIAKKKSPIRLIEVNKRASHSDQAKFLRSRVDLPIEKPL